MFPAQCEIVVRKELKAMYKKVQNEAKLGSCQRIQGMWEPRGRSSHFYFWLDRAGQVLGRQYLIWCMRDGLIIRRDIEETARNNRSGKPMQDFRE